MEESSLNAALRPFEAAEANLVKAEQVLAAVEAAIPKGIVFGDDPQYEIHCRNFVALLAALPTIDGWRPEIELLDRDDIAQQRLDAQEIGEVECQIAVEQRIGEPAKLLREYRYRFDKMRRELVRDALTELIVAVDGNLQVLAKYLTEQDGPNDAVVHDEFDVLQENVAQIATLLGSSVGKPPRWSDLHRHMHFRMFGDLHDIIEFDWPSVKAGLVKSMYGETDPVPVGVQDLGELVRSKPRGPVATKLRWENLAEEEFERLIFVLISSASGYENPEWLTRTNAADRGRDLSVYRVYSDQLGGTQRKRVIIQCKHWQTKSVSPSDVGALRDLMKLWEPPRVDIHVIATSGRFTSDAVALIEKHNQSDSALNIEMWPESHLERLLANRPGIIAQFGLR